MRSLGGSAAAAVALCVAVLAAAGASAPALAEDNTASVGGGGESAAAEVVSAPAVPVDEAATDEAESPERRFLRRLSEAFSLVRTASAEFVQTRRSALFQETETFEGLFQVSKPGKLRLVFPGEGGSEQLFADGVARIYLPDYNQLEVYPLDAESDPVQRLHLSLLGFEFDVDDFFAVYDIEIVSREWTEGGVATTLRFEPLDPDASPLKLMRLTILDSGGLPGAGEGAGPVAADRFILLRLYVEEEGGEESEGDSSELEIVSLEINGELDPELFEPNYPDDVDIIDQR